jgi:sphingolipid delta-4 desaturase
MSSLDFTYTDAPDPHHARTRAILQAHPEVRSLMGHNPWSFVVLLGVLALQVGLAYLLREGPWWLVLLVAYFVGSLANHTMWVLIHEAGHNMIFKRPFWNRIAALLADIPNGFPGAISFGIYHQKHHAYMGVYERDADLAYRWEARLVGRSPVRKALWLLLFPVVEAIRPIRLKGVKFLTGWTVASWVVSLGVDTLVVVFFGPLSLLYFIASLFFSLGLHPVGARWIQEHYLVAPPQETYSYYGIINRVNLNIGYHNEHHDFPSIPWSRLPALKKMAPEWYDNLVAYTSYTRLLWRFLTDPTLTLFSRIVHTGKPA